MVVRPIAVRPTTAVHARNDIVNLERDGRSILRQSAVLASPAGSLARADRSVGDHFLAKGLFFLERTAGL
jgi:hypothetical protein